MAVSSSKVDKPHQDSLPCGLRPESPTERKGRRADVIMLQQLLITLPTQAPTWVKLHHPRKAKKGAPLWEDMTKMFEREGESRLMGGREEKQHLLV